MLMSKSTWPSTSPALAVPAVLLYSPLPNMLTSTPVSLSSDHLAACSVNEEYLLPLLFFSLKTFMLFRPYTLKGEESLYPFKMIPSHSLSFGFSFFSSLVPFLRLVIKHLPAFKNKKKTIPFYVLSPPSYFALISKYMSSSFLLIIH